MAKEEERDGWKLFVHPENIEVGRGRILYAEASVFPDAQGKTYPAGWVLPGGRRTQAREDAVAAAADIDRMMEAWIAREARGVKR